MQYFNLKRLFPLFLLSLAVSTKAQETATNQFDSLPDDERESSYSRVNWLFHLSFSPNKILKFSLKKYFFSEQIEVNYIMEKVNF